MPLALRRAGAPRGTDPLPVPEGALRSLTWDLPSAEAAAVRPPMNAKVLLKSLFFVLVLLLLVLMGMYNRGSVDFVLPPLITRAIKQPAALMYFAFFAIGFLTGTIVWAGGGKGGGGARSGGDRR